MPESIGSCSLSMLNNIMLSATMPCRYDEFRHVECRHAECHYVECHGAISITVALSKEVKWGATTLNKTTISVMTLCHKGLYATLSINDTQQLC